jgi:hypothetical protein
MAGGYLSALRAPFPWFGGKSRAAAAAWAAIGDPDCYVEPFGGSAAVLLARPTGAGKVETYNDSDGLLVNAWRAMASDADEMARRLDWPVSEADMHARHLVLVERRADITARLLSDPGWYDIEAAAWWVWGACCWIGSGWCSGNGPWVRQDDGTLGLVNAGQGIKLQLPHLSRAGQGINRQLPHLSDAGQGIHRQLPHLSDAGQGIHAWMSALQHRLRRVRIACGDWRRVLTPAVVERHGSAAVLLDPPYPEGWDTQTAYAGQSDDAIALWEEVKGAALSLADRGVRVVVCGYSETWTPPDGWTERRWVACGGYATDGGARQRREVLWCSPACLPESQPGLFGGAA